MIICPCCNFTVSFPFISGCGQKDPTKLGFHSQSNEDKAIFEKFFLHPPVCHGTFVELGALDGRTYSNSLFFERYLNWSGVLIEGNPELWPLLDQNRPYTTNVGAAVCQEGQSEVLFVLNSNAAVGGDLDNMSPEHWAAYFRKDSSVVKVPCKPIGRILNESNVQHVDLFSIDVEGSEQVVLETMDWRIPVHVVLIEMGHGKRKDKRNRDFLERLGFVNTLPLWNIQEYCTDGGDCAPNEVFVNPNYPQLSRPGKH